MNLTTELLRESGIPRRFDELDIDTFPEKTVSQYTTKYARKLAMNFCASAGLFIYGEKGTGRTFLSIFILRQMLMAGKSGMYLTYDRLVSQCLDSKESNFEAFVLGCSLLVIDNISLIQAQPGYFRVLSRALQVRSDADYPTVLVSAGNVELTTDNFGDDVGNLVERNFCVLHTRTKESVVLLKARQWRANLFGEDLC
jgi:DNA replication protein DnaC